MIKDSKIIKSKNFEKVEKIVITLHGYGTSGNDFAEVGEIFLSKAMDNTVFLFPDAPYPCDSGFGKQWFTLDTMTYEELRSGLEMIAPILEEYINSASKKFDCDNINLMGFSQGAITCFEMLYNTNISKIVSYSGLFAAPKNREIKSKDTSVLIVHSDDDEVVPYKNAILSKNELDALNIKNEIFICHGIGHSISIEGWNAGVKFLCST